MDGAKASYCFGAFTLTFSNIRVGGRGSCTEFCRARSDGAAPRADLGGSSGHSTVKSEDRRGNGFHENTDWPRISRS